MPVPVHSGLVRAGRSLRVAIVEDDRTTRDGLATLVKGTLGYLLKKTRAPNLLGSEFDLAPARLRCSDR